jgi:hypothetical protein
VIDAWQVALGKTFRERKYYHATIFLLMRHIVETVDGVSVLVAKGSKDNCGLLLRSSFEAMAGIVYILKADTERRALAYQVAHIHRKIKLYRKFVPTDDVGRQLRVDLKDDQLVSFFDLPITDWQKRIDGLKRTFAMPEYAPIQAEWERLKKERKGDPNWYTLFGGPSDMRKLALDIGRGSFYEILYRPWSDFTHAEGVFGNISQGADDDVLMKPVRSPKGIEQACNFACHFCLETVRSVLLAFAPDEWLRFERRYSAELRARHVEVTNNEIFKIGALPVQ